jgi:hypothetical protein
MQEELAKLDLVRRIELAADLFGHTSPRYLKRCRRRVVVEALHELRRHPHAARITWLPAFVYLRARSLTDDLVDVTRDRCRCCEPRSGENLTSGICLDSLGQQVDIPIFGYSAKCLFRRICLATLWDSIEPTPGNFPA